MPKVKRALISVSDKAGVKDLARELEAMGVEILSTGGTARLLADAGIEVTEVADYTGFPELMDGRIKTLHPTIHGGILGRRGVDDEAMDRHQIGPIDLVVVNLYPFEQTVAQSDCDLHTAVENIDIGGPAMVRAAAKNYDAVTVIIDPDDYERVLAELSQHDGAVSEATRRELATKAFAHTARYDGAIANYLGAQGTEQPFPPTYSIQFTDGQPLRYGENPHQRAAFYREHKPAEACVATARLLQGKALSFNNIADADAAVECVKTFYEGPACVIIKHANPCGVALGTTLERAYEHAYESDPTSAFGGIIAFNQALDGDTARTVIDRQFVEVIIAPEVMEDAREVLATKPNVRVLVTGSWGPERPPGLDFQRVNGGLLVQDRDNVVVRRRDPKTVSQRPPSQQELTDLLFAWKVAKLVKSNAIVYARDGRTVGIGAGQMSRVDSARIAGLKAQDANLSVPGSVMASDAFFPFRDSIDQAAAVGITAVIQPGGSRRDDEVIDAANEHDIAMVFTGVRHFRH